MPNQTHKIPAMGLLLLIIGVTALVFKSSHGSRPEALLGALFFLIVAGYFAFRSFESEETWWMILPAGLAFTVSAIVVLRHWAVIKPNLLWVIFFSGMALTLFLYWQYHLSGKNRWARTGSILSACLACFFYVKSVHLFDTMTLLALLLLAGGIWLMLNKDRKA
jgi:hypothetical protein